MLDRKPRVVYWNNIPSPYAVEQYNILADRGNLDFEVWFNDVREPDRSWDVNESDWRFRARYIPGHSLFGQRLHLPLAELYDTRPDVVVCLYYEASFALGSLAARALASRTLYAVMPTYDSWSQRTWWRELGKHVLFRSIDGVQASGLEATKLSEKYGLPNSRSYVVTESINVAHYARAKEITPALRRQNREQLGLHGCVFLCVGRLWEGKGLDYLFEAYKDVQLKQPDISLLLIGDGVDEPRYRAMARDLPGVVFTGFVQARDMPMHYALGDVLVFPTLGDPYGHVVEEAMVAGLPVISTESAGEIRERILDGKTGYIIPAANATVLADRMLQLAGDPALRMKMASAASFQAIDKSHERYTCEFEALVDRIVSTPARRTPMSILARGLGWGLIVVGRGRNGLPAPYVGRSYIDTPSFR